MDIDTTKVVTQLAASSKALDRAGFTTIATGMRQCMTTAVDGPRAVDQAQLEKLFLSLA